MPRVTYIEANGDTTEVEVPVGDTVMLGAVNNSIEGIIGECGGQCVCATCHCHIDDAWLNQVGPPNDIEKEMIEFLTEYKKNSRLGCQITITDALDGLIVHLPEAQE